MEVAFITAIATVLEIFVIIWGLSQINKAIYDAIDELEEKIDGKLALAIQSTGLVGSGEPVNPIQAAIAQMLTSSVQNKAPIEILRNDNGQFSKKD